MYNLNQELSKIREHKKQFLDLFPKKSLHQIPLTQLSVKLAEFLSIHPDFERKPTETGVVTFHPKHYSRYELGHLIFRERLVSALKSQKLLNKTSEGFFRKFLGDLYYNPPTKFRVVQLNALNSLVDYLGEKKVNVLLEKASSFSDKQTEEYYKNAAGFQKVFGDSLGNPIVSNIFSPLKTFSHTGKVTIEGLRSLFSLLSKEKD
ncbi:Uncharacterised protein [uncultured archaeon]|nr:Uncharacterised protein [uncultured archaeon]